MAHFAEIDSNGIVLRVMVIDNKDCLDPTNVENEQIGAGYCKGLFGGGQWVQCSYNASFRKNTAFIGCKYDKNRDAFIHPQPYPSWTLNEETCRWEPPVPFPTGLPGKYGWNEASLSWVKTRD
jgi:hypothetical protein